jgi:GH35 family endo-1,4-beta-xylanase
MKKQLRTIQWLLVCTTMLFSVTINAQTLRQIAESKGKYIGNLMKDGLISNNSLDNNAPRNILRDNFNLLVTENAMKMENVLPNRPANPFNIQQSELNLGSINNFVAFADLYSMRKRGHTILWHSQAPLWLRNEAKTWTAQQIRDFMRSYIRTLGTYCRGKINEWDVANEMFEGAYTATNYRKLMDGTNPPEVWYVNIGDKNNQASYNTSVYNFIKDCFVWLREVDPEAELFYNDYTIENRSWPKAVAAETLCRNLMTQGAPIDGVGFQTHFQTTNLTDGTVAGVVTNIKEYAKSGLNVHLTELDIRQNGAAINGTQAHDGYYGLIRSCFLEPNCTAILVWGIRDNDSWIPSAFGSGVAAYLLYNSSYAQNGNYSSTGVLTKGAWTGFRDGIAGLANKTFPDASLVGNGNPGTVVTTTSPVGKAIYMQNGGKYVSSENGVGNMNCNRTSVGTYERFTVVSQANGKVALKGTNGRYVSNENGTAPITCNRTTVGTNELFDLVNLTSTSFQLRGSNARFVSSENGTANMTCNRTTAGAWETFNWAVNGSPFRLASESSELINGESTMSIFPNPAENVINMVVDTDFVGGDFYILDQTGMQNMKALIPNTEFQVNVSSLKTGLYITKAVSEEGKIATKKLVIK